MGVAVVELGDDAAIRAALEPDPAWAAYALCDLEPPYRPAARYVGAVGNGAIAAIVLLYALPGGTSLMPCGNHDGVRAIMEAVSKLPTTIYLHVRPADLPAVERRYRVSRAWTMWRMVVDRASLRPAPPVQGRVVLLGAADLPALQALYALWPETVFTPAMLDPGVYFGVYRDGALVAVAGTHTVGRRAHIATIGNVFTHPAYRGRGLARVTTAAVARALFDGGVETVILNVAADNAPARSAYQRLGFTPYRPYWEGDATLR